MPTNYREQSLSGDLADFARQVDDRKHHGQDERSRPQQGRPEGCAGTGIGPNGRRVVVRGADNQAKPKGPKNSASAVLGCRSWN